MLAAVVGVVLSMMSTCGNWTAFMLASRGGRRHVHDVDLVELDCLHASQPWWV